MQSSNNKEELQRNNLAVVYEVDGQQIKLTPQIVQDYLVGTTAKITLPEFKLFTELCKVRKLNPFLREAYLIKYSNNQPASIVVGKDAILKRAVLNPKYDGMKSGIIVTNESGEVIERKGTFKLTNETLVGGWAEVYRKDWTNPIYSSVSIDETIQKKSSGEVNSNWSKQPATMIEKVAKVRAVREAFVEDLSGMYEAEEMNVDLPEVPEEEKIKYENVQEAVYTENGEAEINDLSNSIDNREVEYEDVDLSAI